MIPNWDDPEKKTRSSVLLLKPSDGVVEASMFVCGGVGGYNNRSVVLQTGNLWSGGG